MIKIDRYFRLFVYGFLYIALGFSSFFAQESKMLITQTACVDISKILNTINENPNLREFLLKNEKSHEEESIMVQKKIIELEDYLSENLDSLNRDKVVEIQEEIEYQKLELERILLINTNNSDEEITLKGIYRLIKEVAEQDGLSIIIEKSSAVVYNKPEVDITDKIINRMINQIEETEDTEPQE